MSDIQSDPTASDPGVAGESEASAGGSAWQRISQAESREEFLRSWLELQCGLLAGARAGLLVLSRTGGAFEAAAVWPNVQPDRAALQKAAERALSERRGLVLQASSDSGNKAWAEVARPLDLDGDLVGAVVVEIPSGDRDSFAAALDALAWGAGWIEAFLRREAVGSLDIRSDQLRSLVEIAATVPDSDRFREAATRLATESATRLGCDRAAVGFVRSDRALLGALSHSAQFGEKTNLARALEAAMDEVVEQERTILYPAAAPAEGADAQIDHAHARLAAEFGSGHVLSVPLARGGEVRGVLVLEREQRAFDQAELQFAEAISALVGPALDLQRRDDRWIGAKAADSLRRVLGNLIGPRHVALKLGTLGVLLLIAFLVLAKGEHRVTAQTRIEPLVQRAAVAPFEGYLAETLVRAGDIVEKDELLARLDDKDLRLEQARSQSQLGQLEKQARQARAAGNAADLKVLQARIDQIQAQLSLVTDRLSRTEVRSPFDGIVVQGDLSQALGSPVQQGDLLFEVAPLDSYRVALDVDERDVRSVAVGQEGRLVLSASPGDSIPLVIERVTPVSTAGEGQNFFRVEAELLEPPANLRPGMEGVAKINAGERRLSWIWFHRGVDWLRLTLWRWLP